MKITRASIVLEINGHPHAMLTDGVDLDLLVVRMATAMPTGKLPMVRLGSEYHFEVATNTEMEGGEE